MLQIGSVKIENRVMLAPMEDVSNIAFRQICKQIGNPGLMFTEFVSASAIHHGALKTLHKMVIHPDERPVAIQIFGGDPDQMAETARVAEEQGADIVDINMGCWVPKVVRQGAGAALLKDPENAERIVRRVVEAVKVPVTVKVRAGFEHSHFAAPEMAKRFEAVGAKMITLHARFAKQGFDGVADWSLIGALKKSVSIPVVGNGDIKTGADALRLLHETGCDGVMIGRAAIGNPWVLREINETLDNNAISPPPSMNERINTALLHCRLMIDHEAAGNPLDAELRAVRHLRGQLPLYVKGEYGASTVRHQITQLSTYAEIESTLREYEEKLISCDFLLETGVK